MNREIYIEKEKTSKKCKCTPVCADYFKVDGFDLYCKKGLESLAFDLINKVNGTKIMQGNHMSNGWTSKQEVAVIEFINKNGVQNGTYVKIGLLINKNKDQVKRKVYELEKKGRLSFDRVRIRKMASDAAKK